MTLSRTEEIRQVASEWEFDKRIPAPRAARLLRELLHRVDELERGIGQMRLLAGLPLPPDVAAKVAEADRLRKQQGCPLRQFAIATGLRLLREAEGLKQSELAEKLAVSQASISRRETYRDALSIESLEEYAGALGVDVPTFLERLAAAIRSGSQKGGRSST